MFEVSTRETLQKHLNDGIPFAIFRFPGEVSFHWDSDNDFDIRLNEYNLSFGNSRHIDEPFAAFTSALPTATDRNQYLAGVGSIIHFHRKDGGKTVVSRIITGKTDIARLIQTAEKYFDANLQAFCLLTQSANGKLWLMATPELLLDVEGDRFTTMALAGTRAANTPGEWDDKNIEEQKIVSDYILARLNAAGHTVAFSAPHTLASNNIEHLCTVFAGKSATGRPFTDAETGLLVDTLSPTPAVCGFPVDDARRNIARYESHERGLYSGYTVVRYRAGTKVFVNLRCALVDAATGRFALFTGSGVTASSVPEEEWKETETKALPLLNVLQNNLTINER